jgi:hypothetical protein
VTNAKIEGPAQATAAGQGGNHLQTRRSETIAAPQIEFGQRVCSALLILNRNVKEESVRLKVSSSGLPMPCQLNDLKQLVRGFTHVLVNN